MLLYVDDMLIIGKDMAEINELRATLKNEFEMKDLGATKKIHGMEIQRNRKAGGCVFLNRSILRKFCNPLIVTGPSQLELLWRLTLNLVQTLYPLLTKKRRT